MSGRPLRPCGQPGCPALVASGRCPAHTVKRSDRQGRDPDAAKFYSSSRWQKIRAIVRRSQPICMECKRAPSESVDHINGDINDNRFDPSDPENSNLRALCNACHASKSGAQHNRYKRREDRPALHPIVILVGPAGVGKTAIRKRLAPLLGATSLGPDDFDGDWPSLYRQLDTSPRAVVECCIVPGALSRIAQRRGAYIVHVTLDNETRRQRLKERGHTAEAIRTFMAQHPKLGYEQAVFPDLTIEATGEPSNLAGQIVKAARAGVT